MWKAIILPQATLDIKEAAKWYNERQTGLGKRFLTEVRTTVLYMRQDPEKIALRYNEIRCAIVLVFPFLIHFKIDKTNKTILVVAVFHTSLNPMRWQKRT